MSTLNALRMDDIYAGSVQDMVTTHSLTMGDIMGEDHDIWVTKGKNNLVRIIVDDETGATILDDEVNRVCAETFADFCRSYLRYYDKLSLQVA